MNQNQQAKPSPTISVKQCARVLNYSEAHIYRLASRGHLPKLQRAPQCPIRFEREIINRLKKQWGR